MTLWLAVMLKWSSPTGPGSGFWAEPGVLPGLVSLRVLAQCVVLEGKRGEHMRREIISYVPTPPSPHSHLPPHAITIFIHNRHVCLSVHRMAPASCNMNYLLSTHTHTPFLFILHRAADKHNSHIILIHGNMKQWFVYSDLWGMHPFWYSYKYLKTPSQYLMRPTFQRLSSATHKFIIKTHKTPLSKLNSQHPQKQLQELRFYAHLNQRV